MRIFATLLLSVVLITAPARAQDASQDSGKPFEEMTVQELGNVDRSSLSKVDRKAHKKALRAAKKAEKKRLAEEKKRQKRVKKLQKKAVKIYAQTTLDASQFLSQKHFEGPSQDFDFDLIDYLAGDFPPSFELDAYLDEKKKTGDFRVAVRASVLDSTIDASSSSIQRRQYADASGLWPGFFGATMTGGEARRLKTITRSAQPCNARGCRYYETAWVYLNNTDLFTALTDLKPLEFRVHSRSGRGLTVSVPYHYVLGFAWKLAEQEPWFEELVQAVHQSNYNLMEGIHPIHLK